MKKEGAGRGKTVDPMKSVIARLAFQHSLCWAEDPGLFTPPLAPLAAAQQSFHDRIVWSM